jgi:hypothetical protein
MNKEADQGRAPEMGKQVDWPGVATLRPWLSQRILSIGVDEDSRSSFAEGVGEAGVIGVCVGQHQGLDVARAGTDRPQVGLEVLRVAGYRRVDRGEAASVFDQVPIDPIRAQAVDPGNDLDGPRQASAPHQSWVQTVFVSR